MRDIQVSRPVLIALVGAILVGGFLFFKSQSSTEVAPPPAMPAAAAATDATGGSTAAVAAAKAAADVTGATGDTPTAAERRAERRKKLVAAAEAAGMPLTVYNALHEHKVVLIFFRNVKGQTDQHVNQAVDELKGIRGSKVLVIKEDINDKPKYNGIARVAEITQTPGIVMVYGVDGAMGDSWEGYIDSAALDARFGRLIEGN